MAQNSNCDLLMGILLVAMPIITLLFGNDEPAMQTDQAALVMTGMIFVGIIMIANSRKKSQQTPQPVQTVSIPASSHQMTSGPSSAVRPSRYCPYCGSPILESDARFCAGCGSSLNNE